MQQTLSDFINPPIPQPYYGNHLNVDSLTFGTNVNGITLNHTNLRLIIETIDVLNKTLIQQKKQITKLENEISEINAELNHLRSAFTYHPSGWLASTANNDWNTHLSQNDEKVINDNNDNDNNV